MRATGHEFFDYVNRVDAAAGAAFNGAMNEGSRLQGLLLLEAFDFAGVRSICDVDWDDERCVTILQNVRRAMAPGARVLVTEMPVPETNEANFAKVMDLEMLILTGSGRERTAAEYRALFSRVGLRIARTIPLATGFTVFEPRA